MADFTATKLFHGYGINDYSGKKSEMINGKHVKMPFYRAWFNMLERCFSENLHNRRPTYKGCTVCESWLSLTNFKKWHDDNYIEGFHLDKDIIKRGNKVYSPENCRYISGELNNLLIDCGRKKGKYRKGVSISKKRKFNLYHAQVSYKGKVHHIGFYPTEQEARLNYNHVKAAIIMESVIKESDLSICNGLISYIKTMYKDSAI